MCNSSVKQVSVSPCNIKSQNMFGNVESGLGNKRSQNMFGNVESGLQMLFLVCTLSTILVWMLAMNQSQLVIVFSDWLTQRSITRLGKTSFTKWCYTVKLLFLSPATATSATIAEVESSSTFCETCLTMEVQKSFMKSTT